MHSGKIQHLRVFIIIEKYFKYFYKAYKCISETIATTTVPNQLHRSMQSKYFLLAQTTNYFPPSKPHL